MAILFFVFTANKQTAQGQVARDRAEMARASVFVFVFVFRNFKNPNMDIYKMSFTLT